MEELLELKEKLLAGDFHSAIALVDELETMSRQDKINTLESFLTIILIHLIKIQVEKKVTKSWYLSITNSLLEIKDRNKLGKNSYYIKPGEWDEHYENKLYRALIKAASEVFGGIEIEELEKIVDYDWLKIEALKLLDLTYSATEKQIVDKLRSQFDWR